MTDTRIPIAAGLMSGVVAVLSLAAAARAGTATETRYACDGAQKLVVRQTANMASVDFIDRSYLLQRARSSTGQNFLAPNAALIIDGQTAVFVAQDRLQLGKCLKVRLAASAS